MMLYHIQAEDAQGENLDWFVVANDPPEALKLWGNYLTARELEPDGTIKVRLVLKKVTATRFEGGPRVIEWDSFPVVFEGTRA